MTSPNLSTIYSSELRRKIFASGAIGNVLETYDLILISLMATTLGNSFFPPATMPHGHVIDVFYVFFIGLIVRPIGNIIMGTFADQVGRKKLMVISLICTGLGTAFIGIIPSYSSIGIWSTILFIVLRVFQNFFAGIEYINSATYLIESSDEKSKGFYGSWAAIGISGGYLLASFVALIVSMLISKGIIPEWSWRFIFSLSIVGVFFGLWLRHSIPESITYILNNAFCEKQAGKLQLLQDSLGYIKNNTAKCLSISAITLMGIFLSFIYYVYIPVNLMTVRNLSAINVYSLNVSSLISIVVLIPLFGKLSDHYNRIKMLKMTCVSVGLLSIPFFYISSYGSNLQILLVSLLISIPSACFFSLYPIMITESFPSKIRCTTASFIYQVIVSLQMGTLPLIINFLTQKTGSNHSPAYLLILSTIAGYIGLIYFKKHHENPTDFDTNKIINQFSKLYSGAANK